MANVKWTPKAVDDMEDILFYVAIEQHRPESARSFALEFDLEAKRAASSPDLGGRHPSAPGNWRYWKCKRWLIFYQTTEDGIEVMRVLDPARDFPSLFRDL